MNTSAVGENIRSCLEAHGIAQRELAETIGVTEATMSRWLNGERQPSAYALLKISKVFGTTMESLMAGVTNEQKTGGIMIRVNNKWVIEIDENANYMPRVDKHTTETVKLKDGTETTRPAFGTPIGYYRNLETALKGIVAKEFQEKVMTEEITLVDAIKALEKIRAGITQQELHLDEV